MNIRTNIRINLRKTLLYVAIIVLIVSGAPFLTGMLVETKFKDVAHVLSGIDSTPFKIVVTEYHRGWLKSYAKTQVLIFAKVKLPPDLSKKVYYTVNLEHEIRHGPFVQVTHGNFRDWRFARALIHSRLLLTEEAKKILISELGNAVLFNINSEMAINGAVNIKIDSGQLKLKEHVGTDRIAWKGMQGEWMLSKDMKHLKGSLTFPGFDFDWKGIRYFAQNLVYQTDLSKSPEGLWPGKFYAEASQMRMEQPSNASSLVIDGLSSSGGMEVAGTMAGFSGTLNIVKLTVKDKAFGPIIYANSLKNIDVRVVKSFFDFAQKIKMGENTESSSYMDFLIHLLPEVLKTRPEFMIDKLQVHTEQGDIQGFLQFAIGGPDANDMKNTQQLIQSIAAKASLIFPKLFLREILTLQYDKTIRSLNEVAKVTNQAAQPQNAQGNPAPPKVLSDQEIAQQVELKVIETINKWTQEGTLQDKNQNYEVDFEFNAGKLKINGRGMDLPGLMTLPTS